LPILGENGTGKDLKKMAAAIAAAIEEDLPHRGLQPRA
jgi:hypothetical protein